ncbi:MAG: bacteriophage Gp15 family protein [Bacteroidales bacterium]|nr:Gp15 family bacteriophage protein [Anaerotignum sp.]MCI5679670.1 bacteriophage Gp15 family protein [Bacteroidales bacterium]MDY3925745.1 Gp15 family bacteriophage protein [Anaerotignum sp.]
MGFLTDGFPDRAEVAGKVYRLNTDYRTCIRIIQAMEDVNLTEIEKQSILLRLLYQELPEDIPEAVRKGVLFLNCGETKESCGGERVYSFRQDDRYIFAAVDKVLQGRISKGESVHWWEFVSAFMEMPEDCVMSRIIYYRSRKNAGKLTKEEKEVWAKNRELFELEEVQTAEEKAKEDAFMALLGRNP